MEVRVRGLLSFAFATLAEECLLNVFFFLLASLFEFRCFPGLRANESTC